jgi:hypothetical protein
MQEETIEHFDVIKCCYQILYVWTEHCMYHVCDRRKL